MALQVRIAHRRFTSVVLVVGAAHPVGPRVPVIRKSSDRDHFHAFDAIGK